MQSPPKNINGPKIALSFPSIILRVLSLRGSSAEGGENGGFSKMEIRLEQIEEEGLTFEFETSVDTFPVLAEMDANGECEFTAPLRTSLKALRIGEMVEINGDVETSVRLPCSRCLQPFERLLKSNFALTYMQQTADVMEDNEPQEVELSAEDMGIVYFQGEKINLKDAIQEQVVMEFPLRQLCKPDCKGLCPKCGADMNEDPCDCRQRPSTEKFAALKKWSVKNDIST
jgi:uncharacterized protein